MVAFTAHGLPYQTGSDAPCDAPEVWCELTALLDTQMYDVDQVIGRIDPTVPVAKMTRVADEITTVTSSVRPIPVRFDGVDVDTDNMVDFSVSQYNIRPTRHGTYLVTGVIGISSGDVNDGNIVITRGPLLNGTFSFGYTTMASLTQNRPAGINDVWLKVSAHVPWSADDTVGFGLLYAPANAGTVNLFYATLAAYWVSDVEVFG